MGRLGIEKVYGSRQRGSEQRTIRSADSSEVRAPSVAQGSEPSPDGRKAPPAVASEKRQGSRGSKARRARRTPPAVPLPETLAPYERFSCVSGELCEPPADTPYRVEFRRLAGTRSVRSFLLVGSSLLLVGGFFVWLMLPSHWPQLDNGYLVDGASVLMTISTGLICAFAFLNVATLARASVLARDPIPVPPERGTRVAFLTTIVPSVEPLETVQPTLEAAQYIRHDGQLDIWLLDEGDDRSVKKMCSRLRVRHFTRHGHDRWNEPSGTFKARSKHGNYNAWLDAHGEDYDFFISVDPDHVPLPSFAERFLGYFRDPDVAFVVGPQVYGNTERFVPRAAESQQFLFHSLLQRAGNDSRSAMLVGTNNAVRIKALRAVGGLQDSVTEDMATSLALHTGHNPETGRRWTSVYTPDVVAVGEGPESFTDYFAQQSRWSRGTDQILLRQFWRRAAGLRGHGLLHYLLLTCYYPTVAIAWILGAFNGLAYFTLGAGGAVVTGQQWLMLYVNAVALQLGLYIYNRRHNVSPREIDGTPGALGMLVSAMSAPIYVSSLFGAALGRKVGFKVTPKGEAGRRDSLATFRSHVIWAAVFAIPLLLSYPLGHDRATMRLWSAASLLICLLPIAIWRAALQRDRRRLREAASPAAETTSVPARQPVTPLVIET